MKLSDIQRDFFEVVRTPLTADEGTRPRTRRGASTRRIAESIVAPNDRLDALERIEIYNRQYWFRLLGALTEDFPGLRAVVGEDSFGRLSTAYLTDHPSRSFTLRNLGSQLAPWLAKHRSYVRGVEKLAIEVATLEWAEIETFDGPEEPVLKVNDLSALPPDPVFRLQPYIRLLKLEYESDEFLISIRRKQDANSSSSNSGLKQMRRSRIVRTKLPKPRKLFLAVHRHEFSVYFKRVEPEAFILLQEFQRGKKLSQAINAVHWGKRPAEQIGQQVQEWFTNWASLGWFVAPTGKDRPAKVVTRKKSVV